MRKKKLTLEQLFKIYEVIHFEFKLIYSLNTFRGLVSGSEKFGYDTVTLIEFTAINAVINLFAGENSEEYIKEEFNALLKDIRLANHRLSYQPRSNGKSNRLLEEYGTLMLTYKLFYTIDEIYYMIFNKSLLGLYIEKED